MKKYIIGIMFVFALLLTGAESADGSMITTIIIKVCGLLLLLLTVLGIKEWHIADDE